MTARFGPRYVRPMNTSSVQDLYALLQAGAQGVTVLDARTPEEFAGTGDRSRHEPCAHSFTDKWDGCSIGHIPGAVLLPTVPHWDASALDCPGAVVATICYNHASHPELAWRSNNAASQLEMMG